VRSGPTSQAAQFGFSGDPAWQHAQTVVEEDPLCEQPSRALCHHNDEYGALSFSSRDMSMETKNHDLPPSATRRPTADRAKNQTTVLYLNIAEQGWFPRAGDKNIGRRQDGSHWGGWVQPIGRVPLRWMPVAERLFAGYGEMADACGVHHFTPCDGPSEQGILQGGNAYLDGAFPNLTRLLSATVLEDEPCIFFFGPWAAFAVTVLALMVLTLLLWGLAERLPPHWFVARWFDRHTQGKAGKHIIYIG
jgi:hypothetical protein